MKLEEIFISKYGPISYDKPIKPGNFSLLWGENEDGKTLTIEAILRLLLGKRLKGLKKYTQRVEEEPIGRITAVRKGELIVFPDSGVITDFIDMTPEMFRDLFVITNSDLFIPDESLFYSTISERLTGLKKRKLREITKNLRRIGQLTPGGDFENKQDTGYLKRRMEDSRVFIEEADAFIEESKLKGYENLEENLVELKENKSQLSEEIYLLERARKRKYYIRYRKALDSVKVLTKKLKGLSGFTNTELNALKVDKNRIADASGRLAILKNELEKQKLEKREVNANLEEKDALLKIAQEKLSKIQNVFEPKLKGYQKLAERKGASEGFSRIFIFSTIIFALFTGIFAFVSWQSLITFIASGLTLLSIILYIFIVSVPAARFKREERAVVNTGSSLGFVGKSIEDVLREMNAFQVEMQKENAYKEELKRKAEIQERYIGDRIREIDKLEKLIGDMQSKLKKILTERGVDSIEEYENRLSGKEKLEEELRLNYRLLKEELGSEGNNIEESVKTWERALNTLKNEFKDTPDGEDSLRVFSEANYTEAKEKLAGIEKRIEETERLLKDYSERLRYFDGKAFEILLDTKKNFTIESLKDLIHAKRLIEEFRSRMIEKRRYVLAGINILNTIERSEVDKIKGLFGKGSSVSKIFLDISNGLYHNVDFVSDNDEQSIIVERRDGVILSPEKLSGGAYDQLYFSIRIALADRLFGSEKGFFILDDPFIKSDKTRFEKQIDMLIKLAESGWQILYFSAKDEVKQKMLEKGKVKILSAPSVSFK